MKEALHNHLTPEDQHFNGDVGFNSLVAAEFLLS